MLKKALLLILLTALTLPATAKAGYFTIQFKNGNNINKYWDTYRTGTSNILHQYTGIGSGEKLQTHATFCASNAH